MPSQTEREYDAARLANFGRDVSNDYARFLRAQGRLVDEINAAIDSGVNPVKIAHDVMGRCITHEARVELLSVLSALATMEKIPAAVFKPFEKGIRPRRV